MKVFACSRDPGGARALLPVLSQLCQKKPPIILRYMYSAEVFEGYGWQLTDMIGLEGRPICDENLYRILLEYSPDVLVASSTDWRQENAIESRMIVSARRANIPSVVILDHVCNVEERFGLGYAKSERSFLPDLICLPNDSVRKRLIELGVDPKIMIVTGFTAFDPLISKINDDKLERENDLGRRARSEDDLVLFFPSEPIKTYYPDPTDPEHYGFDEHTTLNLIIPTISSALRDSDRSLHLLLKPHPKDEPEENLAKYVGTFGKLTVEIVNRDANPLDLIAKADAVLGMTSMLLVEAVVLGKPTFSIQIGRSREDVVVTNNIGASMCIEDEVNLKQVIFQLIYDEDFLAKRAAATSLFVIDGKASKRAAQYIAALVRKNKKG